MTQNNTPQVQQPLGYTPDFTDQLTQLQRTAPSRIRTPGALASNLLADALLQYGARYGRPAANSPTGFDVQSIGRSIPTVAAPPLSSFPLRPSIDDGSGQ